MQRPRKNERLVRKRDLRVSSKSEAHCESETIEDAALDRLLDELPDVPVSSNFTAQVAGLVQHEEICRAPNWAVRWRALQAAFSWPHKFAVVSLFLAAAIFSHHQYRLGVREEVARSVAAVGHVASIPTVEMLENFEAIRRLNLVPQEVDMELLAALQ
ncbi:MAG: hypothetical protein O2960_01085 [Verrucomicrobia bacterium]|nr:hypothetical protein [Verrucomicrobiota bacterium]